MISQISLISDDDAGFADSYIELAFESFLSKLKLIFLDSDMTAKFD
jgi:hypothetical protein